MQVPERAHYLYLRGLRQADHTVFCVSDGQKQYYDPQFNQPMPYSSGQQVKRSIMDALVNYLNEARAPITFNYEITRDKKGSETLENREPWSPCDPRFADQLIGGWMRARPKVTTLKRRSPLSVSAMRPLHPLLSRISQENLTFDRSEQPEQHPVRVLTSAGVELGPEELDEWLRSNERTLPRRHWIPDNKRTSGLFVFDIAVDLRRLFRVATNRHDPELDVEQVEILRSEGWRETSDGQYLICPKERRDEIISALAHALVNWRVTSNQSRTYSPQATLALAVSDNANRIVNAIRADLREDTAKDKPKAEPVIDQQIEGVDFFIALSAKGYVPGVIGDANAMDRAEEAIRDRLMAYDYDA